MTSDSRVQELLDRQEICDVLMRYARGVDRVDRGLVRGCFHDDAVLDFGIFSGTAAEVYESKARGEQASDVAGWAQLTAHYLTNVLIELAGETAFSEAYCIAFHRTLATSESIGFAAADPATEPEGESRDVIVGARYLDRFERRDGVWKIAARTEVWEWSRIEPLGNHWLFDEPRFTLGKRDGSDLVFAAAPTREPKPR